MAGKRRGGQNRRPSCQTHESLDWMRGGRVGSWMCVAGRQNGPVPFHWPCSTERLACAHIQGIRISHSDAPSMTDVSIHSSRERPCRPRSRAKHEWTSLARHRSGAGCLCRVPLAAFPSQSAVSADGSVLAWVPAFSAVFGWSSWWGEKRENVFSLMHSLFCSQEQRMRIAISKS